MEDLVLSCLESRVEENRSLYARFLVGPFLKGDALTVATALRRVLLSSTESIGIIALYIQGITHEFSTVVGVRESVLELSLNFGAIVLSYEKPFFQKKEFFDKLQIGYLQVQGPKIVYANHLKLPLGVKLVDPTQYIATVSREGSIVLKFVIGKKNSSLHQNSGSEVHLGDKTKEFSIVEEIGKKNIARAKKKHSYKDGSTIESFFQPKLCKSYFVQVPVPTSGRRQEGLALGLPILPGGGCPSQDVLKLFAGQQKKKPFEERSLRRSCRQSRSNESSPSDAKQSKDLSQTKLLAKQSFALVRPLLCRCNALDKTLQEVVLAELLPTATNQRLGRSFVSTRAITNLLAIASTRRNLATATPWHGFARLTKLCFVSLARDTGRKIVLKGRACKEDRHGTRRGTGEGLQNTALLGIQHILKRCKPLLSTFFKRKYRPIGVPSRGCTPFHLKQAALSGGRKPCFPFFFPCMQNRANKPSYTALQVATMQKYSFVLPSLGKGVQSPAKHNSKLSNRQKASLQLRLAPTKPCFVRGFRRDAKLWSFSLNYKKEEGLQRTSLGSSGVVATNSKTNRCFCKQHQSPCSSICFEKEMQTLAEQEIQKKKQNGKAVGYKSGFLKGGVVRLNEELQKDKEKNIKKTKLKERGLRFLSNNNVFKSDVCLRNVIPLDLNVSPVLKVNFVVEIDDEVLYLRQKIRERIILEVWTDGSVHPRQAVHDSSLRLLDMFASFRSVYQVVSA